MRLVTVQGTMSLDATTAAAWLAMEAEARAEYGVDLNITSPAGAYRSDDLVRDMYLNKAKYKIPASQPVAKPKSLGGKGSVHETGRCLDIYNHTALKRATLVALARRHGFTFTIMPAEPWHMQHDGITAPDDTFTPNRRYPMTARYLVASGPIWAGIDPVAFRKVGGAIVTEVQSTAEDLSRLFPFPAQEVTRDELNRSVNAARLWVEQLGLNDANSTAPAPAIDYDSLAAAIARNFPTLTITGEATPQKGTPQ